MSNPQLSALGFGSRTFDEVGTLVFGEVPTEPGTSVVFDDPAGMMIVLPASTSRVDASTVLVRSTETTPVRLSRKSSTIAEAFIVAGDGDLIGFNAAVGDWALVKDRAVPPAELTVGAVALKANIDKLRAVDIRRKRRKILAGKPALPPVLKPLGRHSSNGLDEYRLSGNIVSWTLKQNPLTRGTWYQVLLDSVVKVTVAVPMSVGKISAGDHLVCDAVMCVTPPLSKEVGTGGETATLTGDRENLMSATDRKLFALGFAARSPDALISEVRRSSQLHRVFEDIHGNFSEIRRYEDPSGAVILLIEEPDGAARLIPLIGGGTADRVETTAGPVRGETVLDIYAGDSSTTGIPADSDDYWSESGTVTYLSPDERSGAGALAVDVRVSEATGPVLRKTVCDPDRGLMWISGSVISSEPQLNELTGLEWYRVTVDAGIPVTVAVPETVDMVPEVGARIWGDVRFCVRSGAWKTPEKPDKETAVEATAAPAPEPAPVPVPVDPASADDPDDPELEDIDDIDDGIVPEAPAGGTGSSAAVDEDLTGVAAEPAAEEPEPVPEPSPVPAPALTPTAPAGSVEDIADRGPLPRGWLSSVEKSLGVDHGTSDNIGSPHVTCPAWSAPFAVTEVRNAPGDPYLGTVHIDLRFPLTASFCDCEAFAERASCVHLYPAFRHLHDVLGEEGPSAEELFDRLGDDPVGAFFKQYVSDRPVMAQFYEVVEKNGGDVHQAVRDVITGIAGPDTPGDPEIRKVVDNAVANDLDMLPVLRRVMTHVGENPDDGSRNDLFRVIDMSFSGNPSQELRRSALQALPTLFTASEIPDDDRRSLAALVVALFRRGTVNDTLPFLTAEDHLGKPGTHTLRSLLGSWRNELSTGSNATKTTDGDRFRKLYRLTAEALGTVQERVTALLEADPPELTTAVLLLESHGDHAKAMEVLQLLLKHLPADVTAMTPYQMPLHDALQILEKNGRKKGAAKIARRQFRENPCWDSYRDLEDAMQMAGAAAVLQERDRILVQLDDTEELTLDEVEVLVRLRLRARDFDKALTVMEDRGLYERGWAADTEDLRGFIRATIGGNLPDEVVGIAFRDAELAARNDGSVDADGLKDATEILRTARAVAGRVQRSDGFDKALATFRKTHRHNALFMALLDAQGLTLQA